MNETFLEVLWVYKIKMCKSYQLNLKSKGTSSVETEEVQLYYICFALLYIQVRHHHISTRIHKQPDTEVCDKLSGFTVLQRHVASSVIDGSRSLCRFCRHHQHPGPAGDPVSPGAEPRRPSHGRAADRGQAAGPTPSGPGCLPGEVLRRLEGPRGQMRSWRGMFPKMRWQQNAETRLFL